MSADPGAAAALAALKSGAQVVLLIGRAGTGKSTFIRELVAKTPLTPQVVLAPTGLAAMQIGGQTVHSFFGLPPRPLLGPPDKLSWPFRRLAPRLKRVIVDEASMLRADVLDAMDLALRAARKTNAPFGGVQMLLVGDFHQLPPVVRGEEARLLDDAGYDTPFAFSAKVLREAEVSVCELTEVHRQRDPDFVALLQDVRDGVRIEAACAALNARCHDAPPLPGPVLLAATNAVADGYNRRGMEGLAAPERRYVGAFEGEVKTPPAGDRLPAPMELALKPGARVIFTQNDPEARWVNGSLGRIEGLSADAAFVRLDGESEAIEVGPASWSQGRWTWDETKGAMKSEAQFKYRQLPLALAWALTIHKAQGMTLDQVEIDLGRGAFAAGQTYVALSRAKSLEGLRLTRPIQPRDIRIDPAIAEGLARWR